MDRIDDWPSSAYLAARTCIDGEPLNADRVTLYRGSLSQTRSWDGVRQQWIAEESFIGGDLVVQGGIIGEHIATNTLGAREIRSLELVVNAANVVGRLQARLIDATELIVNAANVTGKLVAAQIETDTLRVNSGNIEGILEAIQLTDDVKNVVRFHTFNTTFYDSYAGFRFPGFDIGTDPVNQWVRLLRRSRSLSPRLDAYEYIQFSILEWRADQDRSGSSFTPSQGHYIDSLVTWRINKIKSGTQSLQDPCYVVLGGFLDKNKVLFENVYALTPVIYKLVVTTVGNYNEIWIARQTSWDSRRHWICAIQDITGIKGLAADE